MSDAVPRSRRGGASRRARRAAPGPVTRPGTASPPAARRRSRLPVVLMPLLGLLAGAGITAALLQSLIQDAPRSTAIAAEERTAGSIVLAEEDYVGLPVGEVAERLAGLGLTVTVRAEERDDVVPDQVTGIEPAGEPLGPGARVLVRYATAPQQEDRSRGPAVTGAGVGPAAPSSSARPTEPAPPTSTSTSTPTSPTSETPTTTLPASPTGTGTPSTETPSETSTPTSTSTSTPTSSTPTPTTTPSTTTKSPLP